MDSIPNELLIEIFDRCPDRLSLLVKVCKVWKTLIESYYKVIKSEPDIACESESLYKLYKSYDNNLTRKDISYAIKFLPKTPFLTSLCIENLSAELILFLTQNGRVDYLNDVMPFTPSPLTVNFAGSYFTFGYIPFFMIFNRFNEITIPWYIDYLRSHFSHFSCDLKTVLKRVEDNFHLNRQWEFIWSGTIQNWLNISEYVSPKLFARLFKNGNTLFFKFETSFTDNFNDLLKLDQKLFCLDILNERRSFLRGFGGKIFCSCITSKSTADDLMVTYQKLNEFFYDIDWCSDLFLKYFNRCCVSGKIELLLILPYFKILPPTSFTFRIKKRYFNVPHLIKTLLCLAEKYKNPEKTYIIEKVILHVATPKDYPFLFRTLMPFYNVNSIINHCDSSKMFCYLMDNYPTEVLSLFNERGKYLFSSLVNYLDLFLKENEDIKEDCFFILFKLVLKLSVGSNFSRLNFKDLGNAKFKPFFELLLNFVEPTTMNTLFKKEKLGPYTSLFYNMENALVIIEDTENLWFRVKNMKDIRFLLKNNIKFPDKSKIIEIDMYSSLTKETLLWMIKNGFQFNEKSLFDYLLEKDYLDLMYLVNVSKKGLLHYYPEFRLLSIKT